MLAELNERQKQNIALIETYMKGFLLIERRSLEPAADDRFELFRAFAGYLHRQINVFLRLLAESYLEQAGAIARGILEACVNAAYLLLAPAKERECFAAFGDFSQARAAIRYVELNPTSAPTEFLDQQNRRKDELAANTASKAATFPKTGQVSLSEPNF